MHWQNAPELDKPDFLDFEKAFLAWKKNKQYEIVINGKKYKRTSPQSYFDIAGTWGNAPAFVTVMYDHADAPKECGTLDPGESVKVKDGTIFDASAISIR